MRNAGPVTVAGCVRYVKSDAGYRQQFAEFTQDTMEGMHKKARDAL